MRCVSRSKSKGTTKRPTSPWLTGRNYEWDPNKSIAPWVKLEQSLTMDEAFKQLSFPARCLYLYMCQHAGQQADEWFIFTRKNAEAYGISRNTFYRAAAELVNRGFLESKRGGIPEGWQHAQFAPTYFRASPDVWKKQ